MLADDNTEEENNEFRNVASGDYSNFQVQRSKELSPGDEFIFKGDDNPHSETYKRR